MMEQKKEGKKKRNERERKGKWREFFSCIFVNGISSLPLHDE